MSPQQVKMARRHVRAEETLVLQLLINTKEETIKNTEAKANKLQ
jgi:hypothetical protein